MPLETLYITGTPGLTYVGDPRLAYSTVMHLKREGKMLVETTDTPTGKRFKHDSAGAKCDLPADQPVQAYQTGTSPGSIFGEPEEFIILIKY